MLLLLSVLALHRGTLDGTPVGHTLKLTIASIKSSSYIDILKKQPSEALTEC